MRIELKLNAGALALVRGSRPEMAAIARVSRDCRSGSGLIGPPVRPRSASAVIRDVRTGRPSAVSVRLSFLELHVEAEALQLLHEHVERLGHARLGRVLALDDRLVDPRPARHVVAT